MAQLNQLQCVANFRDIGQTVNRYLGQKDEWGIKTIIDLRTKTELIKQAERYQEEIGGNGSSSWFAPKSEIPRIDGIHYDEIKITGRSFERHLVGQLTWWSFFKLIVFFTFGHRVDAVKLIATEVMLPRGLLGLGVDTIDHSGAEIRQALSLYTSAKSIPVLVHCTQGKDRTGLIVILILMILDVSLDAIEHDYILTDAALAEERNERLAEIRQIGLTDDWAATSPAMVTGVQKHLQAKYGGLHAYLDGIGFDSTERANLRHLLMY
ncbi:hypothetical protein QQS21_005555 [Conoideocrella luteorostrata]|uniref:Tyrosine specific protein phosphatases domain-containing protein n=1 Tax=Conoideocrella luteorostrata TaxID=1105319 RepID=A0AAJ0CP65_9HYPO|nr:hypothetical protein QQS21_005555 [Conoideocrella luteorostrata]